MERDWVDKAKTSNTQMDMDGWMDGYSLDLNSECFACPRQCKVTDPSEGREQFYPQPGAMAEPVGGL